VVGLIFDNVSRVSCVGRLLIIVDSEQNRERRRRPPGLLMITRSFAWLRSAWLVITPSKIHSLNRRMSSIRLIQFSPEDIVWNPYVRQSVHAQRMN